MEGQLLGLQAYNNPGRGSWEATDKQGHSLVLLACSGQGAGRGTGMRVVCLLSGFWSIVCVQGMAMPTSHIYGEPQIP